MIKSIKDWLTNHLEADSNSVEEYFKNNNVTGFLIIWTLFEQKIFRGYIKFSDINSFSKKNKDLISTESILDENFVHFHNRYQNLRYFKNLIHKERKADIEQIRITSVEELDNEEKLKFLLYVVYRYRNNIFHGNKAVSSWIRYKEQIDKCVTTMTKLIDLK